MPAVQLRCRDLRPGDILLKAREDFSWNRMAEEPKKHLAGVAISHGIQLGQKVTGRPNAAVVHAGLLFDKTFIIEAQGSGISANDLRVGNLHYGYHVYRCGNASMAAGAGTCAKMMLDINQHRKSMPYTKQGAVGSIFGAAGRPTTRGEMDALMDRILEGRGHPFFCSQFVAYVYQFVAEQSGVAAGKLFNLSAAKVPPSTLASTLAQHPMFAEAGYLMPGER